MGWFGDWSGFNSPAGEQGNDGKDSGDSSNDSGGSKD